MNPYLLEGKYSIKDLVDLDYLHTILEKFSAATGFTSGLVSYPDQELLIATGWRDACVMFHRKNPEAAKHCQASNARLTSALREKRQINISHCESGLVDGATPIIIKGTHLASLATGQVLFSPPDMDHFARQADRYGFDKPAYLRAISQVPVVTEQELTAALSFLSEMAMMIAELGLANLHMKENAAALENEIIERRRVEDSLRHSEQRYRIVFDSIADYIGTHDLDGTITSINPAVTKSLDIPAEEIVGTSVADLMPVHLREEFFREYLEQVKKHGKHDGVAVYLTSEGDERLVEYRNVVVEPPGHDPYVISSSRDVTERITAAREMKKLEGQLRQAQKMEAVGTLAGGVAHDFNNMLQIISGYLQVMEAGRLEEEKRTRAVSKARDAVSRASELVRRILTFSRKVEPKLRPLHLGQTVEAALKLAEHTFPRMINIETDLAGDLAMISADPNQVEQMVLNLGVNAADAMPEGGTLTITARNRVLDEEFCRLNLDTSPGPYVELTMADNGVGMDQNVLEHIFDPFFTTKQMGKGTGLGLSTVYGMVKNHHGHITVQSTPGGGATFTILFPAVDAREAVAEAAAPRPSDWSQGSEHILLVDDEEAILEVGRHFLQMYGYRVSVAVSGERALSFFNGKGDRPDLVVMDLSMPGMGGDRALAAIREIDPRAKVLISSGYSTGSQAKIMADQSAQGFIAKPYSINDLLHRIREVLDHTA